MTSFGGDAKGSSFAPLVVLSGFLLWRRVPSQKDASPTADVQLAQPLDSPSLVCSLWTRLRRLYQRRRLYAHSVVEGLVRVATFIFRRRSSFSARQRASAPGAHDVHDWHEALPEGFLMPVEVAACRSSPEVSSHLQRLLEERWRVLEEDSEAPLESVPECSCLC